MYNSWSNNFPVNTTDPDKKWSTASGMDTTIKRIHVIQDNSAGTSPAESTYEYAYFTDNIPQGAPSQLRLYEVRHSNLRRSSFILSRFMLETKLVWFMAVWCHLSTLMPQLNHTITLNWILSSNSQWVYLCYSLLLALTVREENKTNPSQVYQTTSHSSWKFTTLSRT